MHNELIVIIMTSDENLDQTWRDMEMAHGGQLLKLSDVALIKRDKTGDLSFQAPRGDDDILMEEENRLATAFAAAIFEDSAVEKRSNLADAGLDPRFLSNLNQALKPDSSACLIYVPQDKLVDTRRYLVILGQLQGDLYHTIFRSQVEEALLE